MDILKDILRQHHESVALIFSKYGYSDLPMTVENLTKCIQLHFPHFTNDLVAELIKAEPELASKFQ